ncbi:MAG: hypothetical protein JSU68_06610 [Phycisphaerales bacterium]|nr:MAG: hypothetical protein JSU68_06610 [Phycisphaerales bacterium]
MPAVKARRVRHYRPHGAHRPRSDQALFLLILAGLVVMALSLGLATSLFHS